MKYFLTILIAISLSISAYACESSHCVDGIDSSGDTVTGNYIYHKCMKCNTCNTINHCENVSGVITDQNDNTRTYKGHWDSYGHIVGLADDGDRVDLNVLNR